MGTRSTIAILDKKGTVNCVFACMDGNIFHNGVILYEHYKDIDKIKNLIQLGAINSLGEEINVPVGAVHTLNQRHAGVTTFFCRDGKESRCETSSFSSLNEYSESGELQEYNYLFKEESNCWYVLNPNNKIIQELETVIINDIKVTDAFKSMINSVKLSKKLDKQLNNNNHSDKKMKI